MKRIGKRGNRRKRSSRVHKPTTTDNSGYTLEFVFYVVMFVIETSIIHFGLGVESWVASIMLAATLGSVVTWGITRIPDILD